VIRILEGVVVAVKTRALAEQAATGAEEMVRITAMEETGTITLAVAVAVALAEMGLALMGVMVVAA
jgi:hypothetical protein